MKKKITLERLKKLFKKGLTKEFQNLQKAGLI